MIRPFSGGNWILRTKATYNIRACDDTSAPPHQGSTGAQYQAFWIAFGNGSNDFLEVYRGTDWWYSRNYLSVSFVSGGETIVYDDTLLAPDDVIRQEADGGWARHTYWYEAERDGQEITFRYSYDGITYIPVFSASLTTPVEPTERVIIDANVWTTANSYIDWDYIYVTSVEAPKLYISQAQTDKLTYALNENVTITCTVQNETGHNITADSVNAEVLKPDSSIEGALQWNLHKHLSGWYLRRYSLC